MSGHNININNKSFMDRLNAISDEFFSYENYEDERYYAYDSPEGDHFDNGEYYCGDIALQEKLSKWEDHSGFPEEHFAQPISKMVQKDPEIWTPFRDRVKFDFARELGSYIRSPFLLSALDLLDGTRIGMQMRIKYFSLILKLVILIFAIMISSQAI